MKNKVQMHLMIGYKNNSAILTLFKIKVFVLDKNVGINCIA
jgi:hypothetical protein